VGLLPKDEPVSFARLVRQQADLQRDLLPAYPFAFPANVLFAWRERVPVDRYDVLSMEPRHPSVSLALDRTAERFLLEGWSGPTAEGEQPGWWIASREASLVVPLEPAETKMFRMTLAARTRFERPVVVADLAVLLNGRELGTFSPSAEAVTEAEFTLPASMVRKGLNKITVVNRGIRRVDPTDTTPPGPLARRAERGVWPVAVYSVAIVPVATRQ
jgi:hypothetical protein